MFFLRRFLTAKNEDFTLTYVNTQSVFYQSARYHVLIKESVRRQINEQMCVYEQELDAELLDRSSIFLDPSSRVMQTVYASAPELPPLYTLASILTPEAEEEEPPESGDAPSTQEAAATGEE